MATVAGRFVALLTAVLTALMGAVVVGVVAAAPANALPLQTIVDDGGPNDLPGQKDLTQMQVDYNPGGGYDLQVTWQWDDTVMSGNNTGDACTLFDTDNDGMANYSLCVVWGTAMVYQNTILYQCNDSRSDRCAGAVSIAQDLDKNGTLDGLTTTCTLSSATSPFPGGGADVKATCNIKLSDLGLNQDPKLTNVCSYPSSEPNSDPSDCVVSPKNGFLKIVKDASPDTTTQFHFTLNPGDVGGTTDYTVTAGSFVDYIIVDAGTNYSLTEVSADGWSLASASCTVAGKATGTTSGSTISGIDIDQGATTTCTFTNKKVVTPTAPTQTDVCGLGDNDTVAIPTVPGLTYTSSGWVDGTLTVTATVNDGYVLADPKATLTWTFTDHHTPCVAQTPPKPVQTPDCGPNNDTIAAQDTDEYTYTVGTWVNGTLTVTVAAKPGFVLPATATTSWTFTDDRFAGCTEVAVPTPTTVDPCGVDNASYTWTAGHYTYVKNDDGSFTVTAEPGYYFVVNKEKVLSTTIPAPTDSGVLCVTPEAPTQTAVCGASDNDTITLPTVPGLTYHQGTWVDGKLTVTATVNDGYQLDPANATLSWTFTDSHTLCEAPVPPKPTQQDVCGANNDVITAKDATEYTYSVGTWVDGTLTVTVTPTADYAFPAGTVTSWTFTDSSFGACALSTTPAPTTIDACGADNAYYTWPTGADHHYTYTENADGSFTVTADEGYYFVVGGKDVFSFQVAAPKDSGLLCVTPQPPTQTEECGARDNDTITLPSVPGLTYTASSWVNGKLTVTATVDDGYQLDPADATLSWTFTDSHTLCVAPAPAPPTQTPACGPNNDGVSASNTAAYTYTLGSWVDGKRTVTAVPTADYAFPAGTVTSWTLTDDQFAECVLAPAPQPTTIDACGANNAYYTWPAGEYTYTKNADGSFTVTAKAGFYFEIAGVKTFTYVVNAPRDSGLLCATPTAPVVTPVCGPNNDKVTAAATGVVYNLGSWVGDKRTVTASAAPGYELVPGALTSWSYTDAATACTISVIKTANPTSVPETGANVTFTFTVTNTSDTRMKITALSDSVFGTLAGSTTCQVGTWLAPGTSCSFTLIRWIAGDYDPYYGQHRNVFTATAASDDGNPASGSDDAVVTYTDVKPALQVTKTANPTSVPFTGANVTFTITVWNTSKEAATLTTLNDPKMGGSLNNVGTCTVPQTLAGSDGVKGGADTYTCTYTVFVKGTLNSNGLGYTPYVNVVTATVCDDDTNCASGSDSETVTITWRGRTPGYWKNHQTAWPKFSIVNHKGATVAITPSTPVASVFNVSTLGTCVKSTDTLSTALGYQGGSTLCGGAQILLRAATAALLNEAYFGSNYPAYTSTAQLIAAVNAALTSGNRATMISLATKLDYWNNGIH